MTYRDDLQVPAGAKGWRDPRPWSDVEGAVVGALARQTARVAPGGAVGFTLSYVPYSTLGDEHAVDLSWEIYGLLAGHPATVVEELGPAPTDPAADPSGVDTDALALAEQRWRGWSDLLHDLARLCCHLPDPLFACVDVSVEHVVGSGQWDWTVEVPVLAEEGWPSSAWTAPDPASALRAGLEEADTWLRGERAGHLREADDTAPP